MKITQIRNATVKIEYAGKTFLADPWLVAKGAFGSFQDTPYFCVKPEQDTIKMPMCDLPMPISDVLAGVDAFILTHMHPDHIDMEPDGKIGHMLPKQIPMYINDVENAHLLMKSGFSDIVVLYSNSKYDGISLTWTPCHHGAKIPMCPACGIVFQAPGEKTLYIAGDTIWYDGVKETINQYKPDIIIVNACAATLQFYGRLLMNAEDVAKTHACFPQAKVIVSHMDTVAHAMITRSDMRKFVTDNNLTESILIPADGETMDF